MNCISELCNWDCVCLQDKHKDTRYTEPEVTFAPWANTRPRRLEWVCWVKSARSAPVLLTTDPEEFPALLDHVRQAVSGSQVLIQVSLVRLSQCLLPVHHPLTKEEGGRGGQVDTTRLVTASIIQTVGVRKGRGSAMGLCFAVYTWWTLVCQMWNKICVS